MKRLWLTTLVSIVLTSQSAFAKNKRTIKYEECYQTGENTHECLVTVNCTALPLDPSQNPGQDPGQNPGQQPTPTPTPTPTPSPVPGTERQNSFDPCQNMDPLTDPGQNPGQNPGQQPTPTPSPIPGNG